MLKINFVTNMGLEQDSERGGWGGMNAAVCAQLKRRFDVRYVGPIDPGHELTTRGWSKVLRSAGLPGAFYFYSPRRLRSIAAQYELGVDDTADADFFHGAAPWIACRPPRPYFAYVDASFSTYLDLYADRSRFQQHDVDRICELEASWLERASKIFFSSTWALEETVRCYGVSRRNLDVVGLGGHVSPPARDRFAGGSRFLFVTTDFTRKGGPLCLAAFSRVRERLPDAELVIVGKPPPEEVLAAPGVRYAGFFRKSVPRERQQLEELFARSRALILPTRGDTTPIIITELAYFGCPVLAPARFGIPEMVKEGVSGCLLEEEPTSAALAERMLELCADEARYRELRRTTREHALQGFTWSVVGGRMASHMERVAGPTAPSSKRLHEPLSELVSERTG